MHMLLPGPWNTSVSLMDSRLFIGWGCPLPISHPPMAGVPKAGPHPAMSTESPRGGGRARSGALSSGPQAPPSSAPHSPSQRGSRRVPMLRLRCLSIKIHDAIRTKTRARTRSRPAEQGDATMSPQHRAAPRGHEQGDVRALTRPALRHHAVRSQVVGPPDTHTVGQSVGPQGETSVNPPDQMVRSCCRMTWQRSPTWDPWGEEVRHAPSSGPPERESRGEAWDPVLSPSTLSRKVGGRPLWTALGGDSPQGSLGQSPALSHPLLCDLGQELVLSELESLSLRVDVVTPLPRSPRLVRRHVIVDTRRQPPG